MQGRSTLRGAPFFCLSVAAGRQIGYTGTRERQVGEMDAKKTGALIAERRKALGLTQKELAERLMVSDKAVSKWETGVSRS